MANWSEILAGLASGGAPGAIAGSTFGPIGTAIGGGLGALAGGLSAYASPGSITGKPSATEQLPRFSPQQQAVQNNLLQMGQSNFDPQALEDRARRQFNAQTIPSLAERFTSMGAGSRGSSAFEGTLGQAGADLESQLAALRSQYGLQALQMGLQPSFENIYIPQTGGLLQGAAPYLGQALGSGLASQFGNMGQGQFGSGQGGQGDLLSQLLQLLGQGGQTNRLGGA